MYRGRGELIDHLLVSHVLTEKVEAVTTGSGTTPSAIDNPNERCDAPAPTIDL